MQLVIPMNRISRSGSSTGGRARPPCRYTSRGLKECQDADDRRPISAGLANAAGKQLDGPQRKLAGKSGGQDYA